MSILDYSIPIKASPRVVFGKYNATKVRKQNLVPCSVYSLGNPFHVTIECYYVEKLLADQSAKTRIITLDVDGKLFKTVIKQVAINPISEKAESIEFIDLAKRSEINVQVPLGISGDQKCPGLKKGGKINVIRYEIPVVCTVAKKVEETIIPHEIIIDISNFGLRKTVNSTDIALPNGVKVTKAFPVLSIVGRGKKEEDEKAAEATLAATPAATATPAPEKKKAS